MSNKQPFVLDSDEILCWNSLVCYIDELVCFHPLDMILYFKFINFKCKCHFYIHSLLYPLDYYIYQFNLYPLNYFYLNLILVLVFTHFIVFSRIYTKILTTTGLGNSVILVHFKRHFITVVSSKNECFLYSISLFLK